MIRNARDIGALIREERTRAGWDQRTLALKAGVSRLWINEVERGKPGAGIGRILNTLAVLGVELQPRVRSRSENDAGKPTSADMISAVLTKARSGSDE